MAEPVSAEDGAGSDPPPPAPGERAEGPPSSVVAEERHPADYPADYPPDPAGTRPKVTAASLLPGAAPIEPGPGGTGRALGQTFRVAGAATTTAGRLDGAFAADLSPDATAARIGGEPTVESPHAPRFQFILGALLALGLSAIAITAYVLGSGRDSVAADWSAWHPTAEGFDGAAEIGNHVAAEYLQPGTGQLLAVKGGPLALAGMPVTIVLKTGAAATGGISVLSGNTVLYKMCGLGPSCTIVGKASPERLMLVRREALELALYTFQYVSGADQVVVFLPPVLHSTPVPGQPRKMKVSTDSTDAVFFRSADLASELSRPLTATLTRQTPSLTTVGQAPDTALVNGLTTRSFYKFSFVQTSQDASLFLVLQPVAAGN